MPQPALYDVGDEPARFVHHEVGLERHRDMGSDRGDHIGAEREVGHEAPVHHVELDSIDAGFLEGDALVAEAGQIGR